MIKIWIREIYEVPNSEILYFLSYQRSKQRLHYVNSCLDPCVMVRKVVKGICLSVLL